MGWADGKGSPVGASALVPAAADCRDPAWADPSLDATGLSETGEVAKSHLKLPAPPGLAGWVGPDARQAPEEEWAAGDRVGDTGEGGTKKTQE